jgi:uncharacterized protein
MRFTQDLADGTNVVRAYTDGGIRVGETVLRGGVILSASQLQPFPEVRTAEDWSAGHVELICGWKPQVVLLGTGRTQQFPDPGFGARFLRVGIGFEVMDTGAACRTFNVLVSERRDVVAMLVT